MKLTLERITDGDEEVVIRYYEMDEEIEAIAGIVQGTGLRIPAVWEGQTLLVLPEMVYYIENVDGTTYAYLDDKIVRVPESLRALELHYGNRGFFRCSKSMILNIYKIGYLKSEPHNRIRATMENGEQVMISRKYAKELRQILRGGMKDEE